MTVKRKVYVDMDGVIADFFQALENRYGVDHWKDIDIDLEEDRDAQVQARRTRLELLALP